MYKARETVGELRLEKIVHTVDVRGEGIPALTWKKGRNMIVVLYRITEVPIDIEKILGTILSVILKKL